VTSTPTGSVLMDAPQTIDIPWTTQYELTINSDHGTPVGAGWYAAGEEVTWSVTSPAEEADGSIYIADPSSGLVIMDGPKVFQIEWIEDKFSVSGTIRHWNSEAIPDVQISLSGNNLQQANTGQDGNYIFSNLRGGNTTVTPKKEQSFENLRIRTIGALDASLVARHAVGLEVLSSEQEIAANVSGDEEINSFDASLIAQFSVGVINGFPSGKFWDFLPSERIYDTLKEDKNEQNYAGILLGDVSGNWSISPAFMASKSNLNETSFSFSIENASYSNRNVSIPLYFECQDSPVYSLEYSISYNPNNLNYESSRTTSLTEDFYIIDNKKQGQVTVALYGIGEITQSGTIAEMIYSFSDLHKVENEIEISISDIRVNECIVLKNINRRVEILPETFSLLQNYPNPFNAFTSLHFTIPRNSKNIRTELKIYDITGKLIYVLLDDVLASGSYTVNWDGRDHTGNRVGTGIYFCHLHAGEFSSAKKMVLVK